MKAAVLHASQDIRYEECPTPEIRPGCVKINVRACGICGSDIPRVLGDAAHFFPIVLGHEAAHRIVTDRKAVWERLFNEPWSGVYAKQVKDYTFIGSRVFGGMAEYVVIPARNAVKFSAERSFEEAALLEPATVGCHGVLCNDFKGGGTTAVVGAGTIGLFTAQWAALLGASKVVFFDVDDDRLQLAKDITGFDGVNTRNIAPAEAAKQLTGRGFDYVFGASGACPSYINCFELAANHAHVCFVGTPTGPVTFTAAQWEMINRRELRVTGSWMSFSAPFPGREWTMCAQYLDDGRLKCDRRMIHKLFPLSQCKEVFDCYKNPASVKGRIMLVNP